MKIVAGLGNVGNKYCNTKHNFGFWVIDEFVINRSLKYKVGKGNYIFSKDGKLICLKPTTYMNNSGLALLEAKQYFDIDINNILIVYDDIDLPLGSLRFRTSGGSGGHRGLESIIYQLKTENIIRLKIGIATQEIMRPSEKYVLSPFNKKYAKKKNEMIDKACDGINYYLTHSINETMNKFNKNEKGING